MKKILFAIAALVAFASCQKADLAEQNTININGERVITAYFDNAQTKTTLDGVTPNWASGDKIMLLDETDKQEITLGVEGVISSDGKSVTFTTRLEGTLYAVYPSTATSAEKIETENSVPVTLSAENQDGTFASANICVAKEDDGSLAFKNVTSVLHLTQTATTTKVNEIIITTPSEYIAGTGIVDMSAATPALNLSSGLSQKIKVKSASIKSDYYIAVAPTTLPAGTAFGFATGSELGGTNLSEAKTIAANTIYDIGSMDALKIEPNKYHEYVEIGGLKWATMNIGANSADEAGTYFAWGDVEGQTWIPLTGGVAAHWSGSGFSTAPTLNPANPSVLPLSSDAANVNWGGSWRMPTCGASEGEFNDLLKAFDASGSKMTPTSGGGTGTKNKGVYWCEDYSGKKGVLFIAEDDGTPLFFPAAGYGKDAELVEEPQTGHSGYYLSSTSGNNAFAFCLYIGEGENKVETGGSQKYFGWSVRPVSD